MLSKNTINKKLLLMKISFFFYDFGMAPLNPFLQSIARQRGIPVLVIGIIFTFLPIFNVIVRPVTGYLTDRWRCHKRVLLCASLTNAFFTPLIHFTPDFKYDEHDGDLGIMTNWKFWVFVVAVVVRMMLWMVGDVLQDTICMQILGDDKKNYGSQRVWGAIGWGLSTFLVGACVDWYSEDPSQKNYLPAYFIAMVSLICHFIIASQLECNQVDTAKSTPTSIVSIVSNVRVFSYLVWAVFAGIFTAYIWYYLFLYIDDLANNYHQERIPYIKTIQGFSVTIECCISELPTYFLSGYILKRIGHMNAYSIAFALFSLRFFLYSIIKDPLFVLPVEMLNGVTFAMAFIAGVSYAAEIAPIGSEGTLQGLFGMAFHGIGMSFGSFMAGYTFEKVGSSASFRLLSYVAVFAFVVQTSVNKLIEMKKSQKDNADKPSEIATQDSDERF